MMNDKEIQEVLGRGKPSTYSFDPSIKTEITRATLDVAVRDIKRHLGNKKRVSVIIVKE